MKCYHMTLSALNIIFTRVLFIAHAFLVIWRATDAVSPMFWFLLIFLILYILDLYFVLIRRKTREWNWFSMSVLIYLLAVMPCFWVLRLQQLSISRRILHGENCTAIDATNTKLEEERRACNISRNLQNINNEVGLEAIQGVTIPIRLDPQTWLEALEQSMIFILIITRWIAPFYRASHRKLSESLFIYLGIGSDIIELFVLFDEPYVLNSTVLAYIVIGVWTLSLAQFLLPLTGALAPARKQKNTQGHFRRCLNSEVLTIVAIVFMQDGPFLGIRLYVLIAGKVLTYTLIFFTCKNILLILLQVYRFIVLMACVDPVTGKSFRRQNEVNAGGTPMENTKREQDVENQTDEDNEYENSNELDNDAPARLTMDESENQNKDEGKNGRNGYDNVAFSGKE